MASKIEDYPIKKERKQVLYNKMFGQMEKPFAAAFVLILHHLITKGNNHNNQ
jgi:hypothetical protein